MSTINGLPKIVIKHEVYSKMRAYADMCRDEISALGTIRVSNNVIYIDNIFLFNQTVTPASTEICEEDLSKFVYECIKNGIDPSSMKLWWHSHVNMDVFWSATDANTISKLSKEWVISIVSNKRDNFKVRLDIFFPIRICLDDIPYTVEYDKTNNAQIKQEIDTKVRTPFFTGLLRGEGGNFFSGGENLLDQRSFITLPGDPKTTVMVTPPMPDSKKLNPRAPPVKYVVNKTLWEKFWGFLVGEQNFRSVEVNKLKSITPPPKPTPAVAPITEIPKAEPTTEIKKS